MPKATIDDVAKLAGVSIKTVSRVVNQEPNVRDTTRQVVEKAIAELSYIPNPSARNLASHRAHLIGLISACDPQSIRRGTVSATASRNPEAAGGEKRS